VYEPNQPMSNVTLSTIPPTITIDGVGYHNSKDMLTLNPGFFKGVTTTPRRIIDRKKIPATDYLYATMEKGKGWHLSTDKYKKAQLLISTNWINANRFFGIGASAAINEVMSASAETEVEVETVNEVVSEVMSEAMEEPEASAKNAPPLLQLSDAEKFHDVDGRVIEIETRGKRDRKNIYFKVKDVSIGFEMPSLPRNILSIDGLKRGVHYTTFKRECMLHTMEHNPTNKPCKTTLYLTYKGLLRVLFVSRNSSQSRWVQRSKR
jgi:hypothetical protein